MAKRDDKKAAPQPKTVGEQLSKTILPKAAPVPAAAPAARPTPPAVPRSVKEAERSPVKSASPPRPTPVASKPVQSKGSGSAGVLFKPNQSKRTPNLGGPDTVAPNPADWAPPINKLNPKPVTPGGTPPNSGSNGSVSPTYAAAPEPQPIPVPPPPAREATTFAVKAPEVSLIQYNADTLPQELIADLIYEDVGGIEMINIARSDTINGQTVNYSLISNLSVINQVFNPNNILAGQIVYSSQLGQYALDISNKLADNIAYLDSDGNLIIEFTSIGPDELAEIEISANGTIYTIGA